MAAYAALASLMNTVDRVQSYGRHWIIIDGDLIESLREKVRFVQDYLENYPYAHSSTEEAKSVERRIAEAANQTEDVIESHVVDEILKRTFNHSERSRNLSFELRIAIKGLDSVRKMVLKLLATTRGRRHQVHQTAAAADSSTLMAQKKQHFMMGFDDYMIRVMEWLTGNHLPRRVIGLVGMGGIGKTTLARSVYENSLIVQTFTVRAWVTVSQEYSIRRMLLEILSGLEKQYRGNDPSSSAQEMDRKTDAELGQELYKTLSGRTYLVVMDDVWSLEAWDRIKFCFPENSNKSRILVTTRLSNVAADFACPSLEMGFLDEAKSWDLFCRIAFLQGDCPGEFEEIGRKIVKKCKGLPLSIVVIGGLLAKSDGTEENWSYVSEAANSILSSGESEHCSKVLSLSYSYLPVRLKPCFLYMGCFPEDHEIHVPRLIKLWAAEGFLRPDREKSLEDTGLSFLKDLVDRNLVLVHGFGSDGKIKTCKIHDLVRGLCLRVAREEKFLHDTWLPREMRKPFSITRILRRGNSRKGVINRERCIVVRQDTGNPMINNSQTSVSKKSKSLTRSVISNLRGGNNLFFPLKLLRVLSAVNRYPLHAIYELVNLRYADIFPDCGPNTELSPTISSHWNLQTLSLRGHNEPINLPPVIWEMTQLRHLEFDRATLPDPPEDPPAFALRNLLTLSNVLHFKCSKGVVRSIPGLKRLKITYEVTSITKEILSESYYGLHNLGHLNELESLSCSFDGARDLLPGFGLPSSLKKLTLQGCRVRWEDVYVIGRLPRLEVLKLEKHAVVGSKWDPIEGDFPRLKFLRISYCGLEEWNTTGDHFPVLESLILEQMFWLKEIPSGIGEIPTLRRVDLDNCSESAIISAKEMLQEQEGSGYEDLSVRVVFWNKLEMDRFKEDMEAEGFASNNFRFQFVGVRK